MKIYTTAILLIIIFFSSISNLNNKEGLCDVSCNGCTAFNLKAESIAEKCTIQRCYDCDNIKKSESDIKLYKKLFGMDSADPTYSPAELYAEILAEEAATKKAIETAATAAAKATTATATTVKAASATTNKNNTTDTTDTNDTNDKISLNAYILYFTFIVIIFLIIYFILNRMNII